MRVDAGVAAAAPATDSTVVTTRSTEFIDLTDRLAALVRQAGLDRGVMVVQTRHTTTGLLVNEAEPRMLEDLAGRLACWAPLDLPYAHDDLSRRTVNVLERSRAAQRPRALSRGAVPVVRDAGGRGRPAVPGPLAARTVRGV